MGILEKIENFYNSFSGEKGIIGYSVKNKPLYYFCVEKTQFPVVIVQCSIHAREFITSLLCLKFIEHFNKFGKAGRVYFIPAVNPDGIKIANKTLPLYKANANGVDLNVNFDAGFSKGEKNVNFRGQENFIGKHPFSEPETKALRDFTIYACPNLTISFHSKGEEIYYEFGENFTINNIGKMLALKVQKINGYAIKKTPKSFGGYKDWCIEKLGIPSLTIEVGSDNLCHPLKEDCLEEIFQKNKNLIVAVINRLMELKCK